MKITLNDGTALTDMDPIAQCSGYAAESLSMQPGDLICLRDLATDDPDQFYAVMTQLDARINRIDKSPLGGSESVKTYKRIKPGAPVMTPRGLGIVRRYVRGSITGPDHWVVETLGGDFLKKRFHESELTLMQPDPNLTVGREGVDGTPVATCRGYGVIKGPALTWLANQMIRWDVELIVTEGTVFHAARGDMTVLVPAEKCSERKKGHIDEDKERAAREANVKAGLSRDGTQPLPEGGETIVSTAEALKLRQAKEARNTPKEELTALSNSELAVALEDAVKLSGRHSLSEDLRPLLEQHAARLMAEQWRRANPSLAACWENTTFEEQPDD